MALRFRGHGVIGDIYANHNDLDGCRDDVFRFQRMSRARRLTWKSSFGKPGLDYSHHCVRWFSRDARFPFSGEAYTWGCRNK